MSEYVEPFMVTYLHNKGVEQGIPISGTFELTQRCNFNCKMCYVHDYKVKKDALSADDWIKLAEQAKNMGTVFLLLTGGEPLIRDDFDEIYSKLSQMGFIISINTNSSLIDKHIEIFKKYPPNRINTSIYGDSEETYELLCEVRRFHKVIENIKLLKENDIEVRVNMVMTPQNMKSSEGIINIARILGLQIKPTAYSFPQIRIDDAFNVRFTPEEAARNTIFLDKCRMTEKSFKNRIESIKNLPEGHHSDKVRCRGGRASFWITADGIMRPCGMMSEPNAYPFRDGFEKAWDDTLKSTSNIRLPKECMNCKYAGICMVCAAMCKAETGKFNKRPDYICRMTKELYKLSLRENV